MLEDTAIAVRELRQRCEAQWTELEALRAMAACARPAQQSQSPAAIGTPQAACGHPTVVKVCGGNPGRWLLIVSCADRRGLLADIMDAVRGLSLSVVRAHVVTKPDGCVHDVFETAQMREDAADGSIPSQPVPLDADAIREALEAAIDKTQDRRGEKRKSSPQSLGTVKRQRVTRHCFAWRVCRTCHLLSDTQLEAAGSG